MLSVESVMDRNDFRGNIYQRVKKELDEGQGCQIKGAFNVYRVPGNFHIGSHSYSDIKARLKSEGYSFDFSYHINHLSFGNKQDFDYI